MKDLSHGAEGRLIFRFAIPMLLGQLFQQLYHVVDSIIVGRYIGKIALAAVGTSAPIIFLLVSFVVGITMGFTIVISQYFGAKKMDQVKKAIDTLYIFMFFTSILVSIAGILVAPSIFRLIDLSPEIVPGAALFLNIFLTGMIFLFMFNGTSAILRGLGDSKTPLYFLVGSVVLNIILDLIFVPVFHWDIAGVAVASVISVAAAFIFQIAYLNTYHPVVKFSFRDFSFDREIFRKSIRIGLPTGFQQTFVAAGMVGLYWIVNQFGVDANAAYSAAGRIDSFAAIPAMSFSIALSTFVGQNLGANRLDRVRIGLRSTVFMTSGFSVFTSLVMVIFGKYLMQMFTTDPVVISMGYEYLIIIGSSYILFSLMFVVNGVLRGAGDTLIPMFISLFSLWIVRLPVAYIMSKNPGIGVSGIWWSIPIGWLSGVILYWGYYRMGRWKDKVVVKSAERS
ncbi:MAG TPA: MATE family efflux transporter [Bacteroidales bacterium]|nr:MATE family efflux transporter [Bacteroidales bacterium]HPS49945.1 MATE family efflux transporter [Bacteroidales bacterium]